MTQATPPIVPPKIKSSQHSAKRHSFSQLQLRKLATMQGYLATIFVSPAHFLAEFYSLSLQNFVDLDRSQQERYLFLLHIVHDLIRAFEKK